MKRTLPYGAFGIMLGILLVTKKYETACFMCGLILLFCATNSRERKQIAPLTKQKRISCLLFGTAKPLLWLIVCTMLGMLSATCEQIHYQRIVDAVSIEDRVLLQAVVTDIRTTAYGQRYSLSKGRLLYVDEEEHVTHAVSIGGGILDWNTEEAVTVGDRILIRTTLKLPESATNPGQFDARGFYRSRHQYWMCKKVQLLQVDSPSKQGLSRGINWLRLVAYRSRVVIGNRIDAITREPVRSLFHALFLGEKELIEENIKESLSANGLMHFFAVSGFHLGLVGMGLFSLLRKSGCSFRVSAVVAGLMLTAYLAVTGFGISGIRAMLMLDLRLYAACKGEHYDGMSALSFAILCILLFWPMQLFQVGFLFSIVCVGAISLANETLLIERRAGRLMKGRLGLYESASNGQGYRGLLGKIIWLRSQIYPNISVVLSTKPIMVLYGYLPLHNMVLNLMLMPFITPIWWDIGISLILGNPIGRISIHPADRLMKWILSFTTWISKNKPANPTTHLFYGSLFLLATGTPRLLQRLLAGFLIAMLLVMVHHANRLRFLGERAYVSGLRTRQPSRRYEMKWYQLLLICLLVLCPILADFSLYRMQDQSLIVTYLDVGQGDCAILQLPNGEIAMIDCGSSSVKKVGEKRIAPFLDDIGAGKCIDYVFLSHPDTDHTSALSELLLDGYYIDHLFLSSDATYFTSLTSFEAIGHVHELKAGDYLSIGTTEVVTIEVLWPMNGADSVSNIGENEDSMVLLVSYQEHNLLFTGDIPTDPVEGMLMKQSLPHVDVLKVAHHGSEYSSAKAFLSYLDGPDYAVVSSGENSYGHPSQACLERLVADGTIVLRTDTEGAIRMKLHNGKIQRLE